MARFVVFVHKMSRFCVYVRKKVYFGFAEGTFVRKSPLKITFSHFYLAFRSLIRTFAVWKLKMTKK